MVSSSSSKPIQLLRKRLRQLMWVTLVLAICFTVAASALAIWWLTSLNGLPDIGDPFDIAAFRASRIPEDQNAFIYLRRANKILTQEPDVRRAAGLAAYTASWSKTDPKLRSWVEENRQALELFLQGAEQSDAISDQTGYEGIGNLSDLVLLEGSKRQEGGDTSGAWECYRAILRMTVHVNRRGSLDQQNRVNVVLGRGALRQRLATWAADPRTTIPQLKSALDEVLETEPNPEWDSFALKLGYLEIMGSLERPLDPLRQQEIEGERTFRLGDMQLSADIVGSIEAARRFLLREPERSRRVLGLLWANWLAHVETREQRPQKPTVRAVLTAIKPKSAVLYPVSPGSPAGARALPPQEVASWLVTTRDARLQLLEQWPSMAGWPPSRAYRRVHRELVIMMATEIYRRERGSPPPSEEALVGTYLKSLPDDGSADLPDETTPTVQ
jgi:hypothetical protein